uniref:Uncharacterized protein n=1 Tax=Arundo donax TaxID=35708 RepID=A0A0A9EAX4_ARUDO
MSLTYFAVTEFAVCSSADLRKWGSMDRTGISYCAYKSRSDRGEGEQIMEEGDPARGGAVDVDPRDGKNEVTREGDGKFERIVPVTGKPATRRTAGQPPA